MFGDRVFAAVLDAGESESGASVHLVDTEYDTGESLRARVQTCEREAVVKTLAARASGELAFG